MKINYVVQKIVCVYYTRKCPSLCIRLTMKMWSKYNKHICACHSDITDTLKNIHLLVQHIQCTLFWICLFYSYNSLPTHAYFFVFMFKLSLGYSIVVLHSWNLYPIWPNELRSLTYSIVLNMFLLLVSLILCTPSSTIYNWLQILESRYSFVPPCWNLPYRYMHYNIQKLFCKQHMQIPTLAHTLYGCEEWHARLVLKFYTILEVLRYIEMNLFPLGKYYFQFFDVVLASRGTN